MQYATPKKSSFDCDSPTNFFFEKYFFFGGKMEYVIMQSAFPYTQKIWYHVCFFCHTAHFMTPYGPHAVHPTVGGVVGDAVGGGVVHWDRHKHAELPFWWHKCPGHPHVTPVHPRRVSGGHWHVPGQGAPPSGCVTTPPQIIAKGGVDASRRRPLPHPQSQTRYCF